MKKLFISMPMRGRTPEAIKYSMERVHKMAEVVFGDELELIDSYIEEENPAGSKAAIYYLGESIKKMAEADYCVCISPTLFNDYYPGCDIEYEMAIKYGIPFIFISDRECRWLLPDLYEKLNSHREET